jgi:hypothetical protein
MGGGGLMQLIAYGAQDAYISCDPKITYYKVIYRKHTNFGTENLDTKEQNKSNKRKYEESLDDEDHKTKKGKYEDYTDILNSQEDITQRVTYRAKRKRSYDESDYEVKKTKFA